MNFVELTENEYYDFVSNNKQESYMQTIELKRFKENSGIKCYLLGVKEDEKVIAATLLYSIGSFLGGKRFYSSRGFIIDYNSKELLNFFTKEISKYLKKLGGISLTIDPNIIYRIRNSNGEEINSIKNDLVINNLKDVGFKHFGFNNYFETLQVRWVYRVELKDSYEELKKEFTKSTRKNIEAVENDGILVRKGTVDDLESLSLIFDETAKRDGFNTKGYEYYKKMYENMGSLINVYIAYIDTKFHYEKVKEKLNKEEENNRIVEQKMKVDMVGSKLINKKSTSDKLIDKYKRELEDAKELIEKYPDGKDIGALISIKSGNEYISLSSGTLTDYKKFNPKYALYDAHIKDAFEQGYKYVNFYGIAGDFDSHNKYYGIYEFKKGFNGNVIEYVGEFTLGLSLKYTIFNLLKKIKKIVRN